MPDWDLIRGEYITGHIGMRTLAKKHGVSYYTMKDRAEREGWSASAREYRMDNPLPEKKSCIPRTVPRKNTPHPTAKNPALEQTIERKPHIRNSRIIQV